MSVDSFLPNSWGLYNVNGNVYDWTEDCWNESNMGNPGDGRARTSGNCDLRMFRGGSWFNPPNFVRSAFRTAGAYHYRNFLVGFRVARALD